MRRLSIFAALLAILTVLAGCGARSPHTPPARLPPGQPASTCTPTVPAQMGVCVQLRFGLPPRTGLLATPNGWDISVYQGAPAFPRSVRFVYNQVGDGPFYRDPNFSTNCARERRQHIRCGAYLFVRPGHAQQQAAVVRSVLNQTDLPPALDVEVPGAYETLCPIVHALHLPVVVAYTAPGLWPGGATCETMLWGAEWGSSGYAFAGWRSFVAVQTCGTCMIDQDSDHGLLSLVEPPKPKPVSGAQRIRELHAAEHTRRLLHDDIENHRCRKGQHNLPREPERLRLIYHSLCGRWLNQGGREIAMIHRLRKLL